MLVDLRYAQKQLAFAKACVGRFQTQGALDAIQRCQDAMESAVEAANRPAEPEMTVDEFVNGFEPEVVPGWTLKDLLAREG